MQPQPMGVGEIHLTTSVADRSKDRPVRRISHNDDRRHLARRAVKRSMAERDQVAGLSWPLPEGMNDEALEAALYANRRSKRGHRRIEEPDWAGVHRELKRKHVTF